MPHMQLQLVAESGNDIYSIKKEKYFFELQAHVKLSALACVKEKGEGKEERKEKEDCCTLICCINEKWS